MTLVAFELDATRRGSAGVAWTDGALDIRPRAWRWPWLMAAIAFVQYTLAAVWMLEVRTFALGDALSRTSMAKMVVLSRDPHLAAGGFYWVPLPTISRIPFVLALEPFGKAYLAGPLTSAMFLALTLPMVALIARELGLSSGIAALVTGLYALNPVVIFSGASGMSETTFGFFASIALYGLVRFHRRAYSKALLITGLALGACMACRYETLVLGPTFGICMGIVAGRARWRMAAVIVTLPTLVVFALWTLASEIIQGDGLFWYRYADDLTATPKDALWLPAGQQAPDLVGYSLRMVLILAPTIVVLLAAGAAATRLHWRTTFGLVSVTWVLPVVVTLQLVNGTSWGVPRFYFHLILFGAIGVLWMFYLAIDTRRVLPIAWVGVTALAVSGVVGALYLAKPERAVVEGEYVFLAPLVGREYEDVEGFAATNGDIDGYDDMVERIDDRLETGDRVAMDTINGMPFLLSRHPKQFIIPESRDSERILADPIGRFELVLIQPGRRTGYGVTLDNLVASDPRWVLVEDFEPYGTLYEFQDERIASVVEESP